MARTRKKRRHSHPAVDCLDGTGGNAMAGWEGRAALAGNATLGPLACAGTCASPRHAQTICDSASRGVCTYGRPIGRWRPKSDEGVARNSERTRPNRLASPQVNPNPNAAVVLDFQVLSWPVQTMLLLIHRVAMFEWQGVRAGAFSLEISILALHRAPRLGMAEDGCRSSARRGRHMGARMRTLPACLAHVACRNPSDLCSRADQTS